MTDFNPRPRKEGDKSQYNKDNETRDFNPRPRKEGDLRKRLMITAIIRISIHALAKRATILTVTGAAIADISIHALAKRATCGY